MDDGLRTLLWRYKDHGGFEAAYDEQKTETKKHFSVAMLDHSQRLDQAIQGMFADVNKAFGESLKFEFGDDDTRTVFRFLAKFDAVFTLNQDMLIERHYLMKNPGVLMVPARTDAYIPGITIPPGRACDDILQVSPTDESQLALHKNCQPYFKLHGSSNWIDRSSGHPMLVIGGTKASEIGRHPILKWNHEQFGDFLSKRDYALDGLRLQLPR
jgi:hypothetical protein